jgi:hypothetical protein
MNDCVAAASKREIRTAGEPVRIAFRPDARRHLRASARA